MTDWRGRPVMPGDPRWRVDYIGKGGKHLGTVEAFNITPARRFKIAVTKTEARDK